MAAAKPRIWILGAGGTIAGAGKSPTDPTYESGRLDVADLLTAVEGLDRLAEIQAETLFSKGSEDLGPADWRKLALRVHELTSGSDVDGVVITHGTDTLEEAAFFLDLGCRTAKPVVLTAAMRPSTALSADGPANIHQAVLTCASPLLLGYGILVALNGLVLPGWQTIKADSVALDAFRAYPGGPVGRITGDRLQVFGKAIPSPLAGEFRDLLDPKRALPLVGIVYPHGGCGAEPLAAWRDSGCRGLVIAGFGAGTMPEPMAELARDMAQAGCLVVVSSRVRDVTVLPETTTLRGAAGVIASGCLNPQKSALLLSLALAAGLRVDEVSRLFSRFSCTTQI